MKKLITALTVPMLLAACSTTADKAAFVKPTDLQHHHWVLAKIDGKDVVKAENGAQADLEIGENLNSHGNAGCNGFRGVAEINPENGQFRIEKMAMTMKMCMGDAMTTERAVSSTLSAWSTIDLQKDTLTLSNDQHTLTYTLSDWVN